MARWIICLVLLVFAQSVSAQPTPTSIRDLAFAGDIEGLERVFADTHRRVTTGEFAPDDMRITTSALIVTHPDILKTSQEWLRQKPDSIYAKSLVAFQIHQAAWGIRGDEIARDTYPDALSQFDTLNELAFQLAYEAYSVAPGYLPASDAIIRLNNVMHVFWGYEIEAIIADVMEQTPKWGTVQRAIHGLLPQWEGEGLDAVFDFCKTYVPVIPKWDGFTTEACLAASVFELPFPQQQRHAAAQFLAIHEMDGFGHLIANAILRTEYKDRSDFIFELLSNDYPKSFRDISLARRHNDWIATDETEALFSEVIEEAVDNAAQVLKFDPFNANAIEVIGEATFYERERYDAWNTHDRRVDFAARRVAIAPYDASNWRDLAFAVRVRDHRFDQDVGLPFSANAIAYGQHQKYISDLISYPKYDYQMFEQYFRARRLSEAEFADYSQDRLCISLRVVSLVELLCERDPDKYPQSCSTLTHDLSDRKYINTVRDRSTMCPDQNSTDLNQLMFKPVPVDLSPYIMDLDTPVITPATP